MAKSSGKGKGEEVVELKGDEKKKMLDVTLSSIKKRFGEGSIMLLSDTKDKPKIPVISTGSISLDIALGIGGVPKGRVIEIFGHESSGKTTLALHIIAEAQKNGGIAAFIDAEHALDLNYAKKLGVIVDELIISQPDYGEQALEIAEILVRSGAVDVIVLDSVAALVPKSEIEGDMGDSHVGMQARLMSQALRKLTSVISKSKTCMIFLNQLRMKIGVMYGSNETTTGGTALKFYSSIRIDIRKAGIIRNKEGNQIGHQAKIKIVKNKLAPPFRETVVDIIFGEGIDKYSDLIDVASNIGILTKSGSWYSYGELRLGQGKETVKSILKEKPELYQEILNKVYEVFGFTDRIKEIPKEEGND